MILQSTNRPTPRTIRHASAVHRKSVSIRRHFSNAPPPCLPKGERSDARDLAVDDGRELVDDHARRRRAQHPRQIRPEALPVREHPIRPQPRRHRALEGQIYIKRLSLRGGNLVMGRAADPSEHLLKDLQASGSFKLIARVFGKPFFMRL